MEYKESKSKINLASAMVDIAVDNERREFDLCRVDNVDGSDPDRIVVNMTYQLNQPVRFIDIAFSFGENSENNP
jgi:hypothetical protein